MEKQEDKVIAANISHYTSTSTRLHRDWMAGIGFGFGFVYSSLKNLLLSTLLTTATILGITGGNQDIVTLLDSFFCLHVPVVIFHIWMRPTLSQSCGHWWWELHNRACTYVAAYTATRQRAKYAQQFTTIEYIQFYTDVLYFLISYFWIYLSNWNNVCVC